MSDILTINDVLEREVGVSTSEVGYTISCPSRGHRDTNPSCRVYPTSDDGVGSLYCFGCGFSANPISLLKEIKGFENYYEVFRYIESNYGITSSGTFSSKRVEYELVHAAQFLKYKEDKDLQFVSDLEGAIADSSGEFSSPLLHDMILDDLKNGL